MKSRLILCSLALAAANLSQAAYSPIAIQSSSYNADVIVESNATPRLTISTTASIDEGTNNYNATLFEQGRDLANPANGVPPAGSTFVSFDNPNYSFQMAPSYTAPNGILIDTVITTGTFTLVAPTNYSTLSFVCLGGNGGDGVTVQVNHLNGTHESGSFSVPDWFSSGTPGIALIMNGRLNQVYNLNTETDGTGGDGLGNPRLFHKEVNVTNTTSPVTSIVLSYASGQASSHNDILAVSGATPTSGGVVAPIAVTGYTYDFIVEASAPMGGRVVSQTIVAGTNVWATDQTLDGDTDLGADWYERGYNLNNDASGTFNSPARDLTGTGLPHPGGFITNATGDHIYQMAPSYTAPDAIYISDTLTNDTITLVTPTKFTGLSFLGAAGNGPVVVNYVITHTGGITETGVLSVADWFNGSAAAGLIANGRVAVDTAFFENINSGFPRLLQNDLVLSDTNDPVVSIYLENTNNVAAGLTSGRFSILAVSGVSGALPPIITAQPVSAPAYFASSVTFTSGATANTPLTFQWQKGTNGTYANVSNGGNISGATSTILSINPIGFTDQADYRMVATNSGGFANSGPATLTVFSTNLDVTQPGDPITGVNISPFGDGSPALAIDNTMNTKFGANISGGIAGMIISPAAGRTIVSALRIYTGADSTGRDPTSFKLEGSTDGGSSYTLISSNSITLTDSRNPLVAQAPNPLTQFVTEVRFSNANGYTTYKLSFPTLKGSGQVQFQELELLGVVDTSKPFFNPQPVNAYAFNQSSASFTAVAIYTPTPTVSWKKKVGANYVSLTDGGNISGSQTTTLNISPATFTDAADYIAVANSTAGFVTSSIAHLFIYSTNTTVAVPGDTIVGFGDTTGTRYGANANPAEVIDATFTEWINGGSGPSAGAGFPPFGGPVGVILTPSVGSTVLAGLRVYPGQDPSISDPSSFVLEGSNDGGVSYITIASGALSLPLDRNSVALLVDPTVARAQEVLFSNTRGFTSYRLTFPSVVAPNTASTLEVGEVEFLGVPGIGVAQPVISGTVLSGGNLHFSVTGGTPSGTYSVLTNANLTVPVASWGTATTGTLDGTGSASVSLPVSPSNPRLFYLIKTP